jgi:RsiW-degrading membrane proteinase PrsW (M82 family)
MLLHVFGVGALLAFPATLLTIPLRLLCDGFATPAALAPCMRAFLSAAIPEEAVKFLALAALVPFVIKNGRGQRGGADAGQDDFGDPVAPLLVGAAIGLGFALVENIFYWRAAAHDPVTRLVTAGVRAFTALPCHVFLGGLMAYYLSLATWTARRGRRWGYAAVAFLLPVFLHGFYDLPLLTPVRTTGGVAPDSTAMLLSLLVLAWLAAFTRLKVRRLRRLRPAATAPALHP